MNEASPVVPPSAPPPGAAEELVARARDRRRLADLEDYQEAAALLLEAREAAPQDPEIAAELAWIYAFWGARRAHSGLECASYYRLAYGEARFAVTAGSDSSAAHRSMSAALAHAPRSGPDARRREAELAVEMNPYDGENCYEAWRAAGRGPDDPLIEKAFALCPAPCAAYCDLGAALASARRLEEAAFCLRKALEINPSHSLSLYDLAAVLAGLGRREEAREALARAGRAHPCDPLVLRGLTWAGLREPEALSP